MALARWSLSALAALVAFGLFQGPAAHAQNNGWTVCNETSFVLDTAAGRPEGGGVIVEGWKKIRPGSCETVMDGPLRPGLHFVYARSSIAHRGGLRRWGGDHELCVDPTGSFSLESPPECAAMGLETRGFRPIVVERRGSWRTVLKETELYSLERARAAGVQRLLTDAEIAEPTIDGYLGRRTRRDIANFLSENNLPTDLSDEDLIDTLELRAVDRSRAVGMTLCNRSRKRVWSAIARRTGDDWESRGWWLLEAGGCARVVDESLIQTEHFVYAEMEDGDQELVLERGSDTFCVGRSKFVIAGRRDCEAAAYRSALFASTPTPQDGKLIYEFFERDFVEPADGS
ncbi:MAG: DUF1036 domain-containing protein [Pseudomonadota bacterium]